MLPFSTEFPVVANQSNASFIAEVIAWLRGNGASTVLESGSEKELEGRDAYLIAESGEELRLREILEGSESAAIGFRHDFPDQEGRLWRTEGVLKRSQNGGDDVVRFRTQCRAAAAGAHLDIPKKPYLIKALLKSNWGAWDGELEVADTPFWLRDDQEGLAVAEKITGGKSAKWLPTVYISATSSGEWELDENEIDKLAYDLGGIAHVVVEPSRSFSFALRDITSGRNVYAGAVGISLPGHGIVTRLITGWQIPESHVLIAELKKAVTSLRERMPFSGWEWSDLQERSLRIQRQALRDDSNTPDVEDLFDNFVTQLEEAQSEKQILQVEISKLQSEIAELSAKNEQDRSLVGLCNEIYRGEVLDRLRLAARLAIKSAESTGLDQRSQAVFSIFSESPVSPELVELRSDLERATKDSKRVAAELIALLHRHGYQEKSDNKHIRLEAQDGFVGLEALTLPKTPSESRGLKNLKTQIERTLGLRDL